MNSDLEDVNDVKAEFAEIDSRKGWAKLFMEIRSDSLKNDYTTHAATNNQNKNLNRYRDVSPYDHSRIVLSRGPVDYINANLVKVEKAKRHYILTQGPLRSTTGHFWLMIWEQKCKAIIMLNRIIEKNQEKCHLYWPLGPKHGGESVLVFNDVGLKVEYVSEKEASYFTTRILRLSDLDSGESREVLQYHYTTWPDFGVPQSPTAFLRFLGVVRASGALSDRECPPVIHCSAGIGRSGTFCLVDSSLVLMKEYGVNSIKVRDLLMEMRKFRMGLIQTHDQLRFSYLAIIKGASDTSWESNSQEESENEEEEDKGSGSSAVDSVCSSNDVSSDTDSEAPPPPPPRRCESLNKTPPLPPPRPAPPLPPGSPQSDMAVKYEERNKKITAQIAEMKRKQEAAESWSRTKRSLLSPVSLGISALILGVATAIAVAIYNRD